MLPVVLLHILCFSTSDEERREIHYVEFSKRNLWCLNRRLMASGTHDERQYATRAKQFNIVERPIPQGNTELITVVVESVNYALAYGSVFIEPFSPATQ